MEHSKKPDEVRNRIVQLCGNLPRIELFARQKADGWDALGYDIDGRDICDSLRDLTCDVKDTTRWGNLCTGDFFINEIREHCCAIRW